MKTISFIGHVILTAVLLLATVFILGGFCEGY